MKLDLLSFIFVYCSVAFGAMLPMIWFTARTGYKFNPGKAILMALLWPYYMLTGFLHKDLE